MLQELGGPSRPGGGLQIQRVGIQQPQQIPRALEQRRKRKWKRQERAESRWRGLAPKRADRDNTDQTTSGKATPSRAATAKRLRLLNSS